MKTEWEIWFYSVLSGSLSHYLVLICVIIFFLIVQFMSMKAQAEKRGFFFNSCNSITSKILV